MTKGASGDPDGYLVGYLIVLFLPGGTQLTFTADLVRENVPEEVAFAAGFVVSFAGIAYGACRECEGDISSPEFATCGTHSGYEYFVDCPFPGATVPGCDNNNC